MGDYPGAVEDFTSAAALDPTNADFYHNRGFSLRKQGRFEAAIADYTRAIELNPGHCRAYYNRAFSRCGAGPRKRRWGLLRQRGQAAVRGWLQGCNCLQLPKRAG